MQYNYTREHMLPVVVEMTYEDLKLIQRMAKSFLDMEKLPEDHGYMYKGDIRKLEREVVETLDRVATATSYAFPKSEAKD
jgi:hypothetical protein